MESRADFEVVRSWRPGRSPARRSRRAFAGCEALEARTLLAVILWDGGGDGTTLTQAANWTGDVLPGPADDAVIDIAGTPTIRFTTGTFTVNSLTSAETFIMSGGTLTIGTASTVSGTTTVSGGTLAGAGTLTIAAGTTLNITGSIVPRLNLTNVGTINWSNGSIGGSSAPGYTMTNLPGAVFNITGTGFGFNGNAGPNASLVNQGTVNVNVTGTTTFSSAALINTGTVNVNTGTLALAGGSSTSVMVVGPGATLRFNFSGSTFTHTAAASLSGQGSVVVSGETVTLNAPLLVPGLTVSSGTLTLNAPVQTIQTYTHQGGTLTGPGNLTVTGAMAWSAGTIGGTGAVTIAAGATLNITSSVIPQRSFVNAGTINWSGGGIGGSSAPGYTFTNLPGGVFNITGPGRGMNGNSGSNGALVNQGLLNFNVAGTTSLSNTSLTNSGTINVNGGTFAAGAGSNTGAITVGAGATVRFDFGGGLPFAHAGAGSLSGTGGVMVNGGTVTMEVPLQIEGTLTLASGSLALDAPSQSVATYVHQGGTLTGAGNLTVTGTMTWSAGRIGGTGTLTIGTGALLSITSTVIPQRAIENSGTINWTAGSIGGGVTPGYSFTNLASGVFNINLSSGGMNTNSGAPALLDNRGTLNINSSVNFTASLINSGTVNQNAGTLLLFAGGGNFGTWNVANVATLSLGNGDFAYGDGGVITGDGVLNVTGGTHTFVTNGTIDILATWSSATLTGPGTTTIARRFDWDSGSMSGTGQTVLGASAQMRLDAAGTRTLARTLVNGGVIDHSAGSLTWGGGTLINNAGKKYNLTGGASFGAAPGQSLFTNVGVFNFSGSGTVVVPALLDNSGAINVNLGTLQLNGGGTNTGKRNVAAGATLHYVGNYTHGPGSTLTGGGLTIWQGGTHTITGAWTNASFLNWTNVTIDGAGTLSTNGPVTWTSGTVQGAGALVINPAGKLTMTTVGSHLLARSITNNGTLIWNNGSLDLAGATITNNAGRNFFVLSGATAGAAGGVNRIVNHGTIRKQLGTALSFGDVEVNTTGAIDVRNGSLSISGSALTQLAGSTLTGGDWSVLPTGNLVITQATITTLGANASVTLLGNGASFDAINGLTTNRGSLTVGGGKVFNLAPAGGTFQNLGTLHCKKGSALVVEGSFAQSAGGTLILDLGSTTGTGVGRILASGSATLAGAVRFNFVSGFVPVSGNLFVFVSATSRTGTFLSETIPSVTGLSGSVQYLGTGAQLRYA